MSTVATQSYQQKFRRIAGQTSFRLLTPNEQQYVQQLAEQHGFTLQELQQVSDIALDRMRWKEPSIARAADALVGQQDGGGRVAKERFLSRLREQHGQLRNATKSYENIDTADKPTTVKPILTTQVKPRLGLGRCPVASEKTRCCNLMTLDAVEKCGFDCSYCSIQSFYHGNEVKFDAGFADKLDALQLDPKQTYHIGTGQSSDSLMWGNHQGVLAALVRFAERNPNVILELKTKSRNIGWLLANDYPENIICTWSLNPQEIIDHEEHLTASLSQRIEAACSIAAKGRLVGFHFHPIMIYQGWHKDYEDICHQLLSRFRSSQVALVSMGTLTFTRSVMKTIRKRPFISKILQMPMEEIAGKFSYPIDHKIDMFKTVYHALAPWHAEVFFYLCMEAQSLWRPVFGHEYTTNIELETAMKEAYFSKIRAI